MGFRWTDTEGVETATNFLHNDSGPLACRLRTLLEEGNRSRSPPFWQPAFQTIRSFEFGIVVASDKRVFQFGFDYLHRDVAARSLLGVGRAHGGFPSRLHTRGESEQPLHDYRRNAVPSNLALQRTAASVAALPLAFAAERQFVSRTVAISPGTKAIGVLVVAVVIGVAIGVAFNASRGVTIHLAPRRDAPYSKQSERRVCAACVTTGRSAETATTRRATTEWDGGVCQWWVAATKGTSLYQDSDAAQTVFFELDHGSGGSRRGHACLGSEVPFGGEGFEVGRVILERCGALRKRASLPGASERVAFPIYNVWDHRCTRPPSQPEKR